MAHTRHASPQLPRRPRPAHSPRAASSGASARRRPRLTGGRDGGAAGGSGQLAVRAPGAERPGRREREEKPAGARRPRPRTAPPTPRTWQIGRRPALPTPGVWAVPGPRPAALSSCARRPGRPARGPVAAGRLGPRGGEGAACGAGPGRGQGGACASLCLGRRARPRPRHPPARPLQRPGVRLRCRPRLRRGLRPGPPRARAARPLRGLPRGGGSAASSGPDLCTAWRRESADFPISPTPRLRWAVWLDFHERLYTCVHVCAYVCACVWKGDFYSCSLPCRIWRNLVFTSLESPWKPTPFAP